MLEGIASLGPTLGLCFNTTDFERHGWVVVLSVPDSVHQQDLRETQSSRNTRCHVQQGFSIAMQRDSEADYGPNQDFARYIAATVRIPISEHWHLNGFRASQSYLFPYRQMDDTYHQLLLHHVASLAKRIEDEKGVACGTLGRVAVYSDSTAKSAVE